MRKLNASYNWTVCMNIEEDCLEKYTRGESAMYKKCIFVNILKIRRKIYQ